jgi:hypothetical protein
MKVFFRCKRSGNQVAFEYESDIQQMRKHEGYEEVKEDSAVVEQPVQVQKQRGRPRKGN